jgi:hypothetical protein
MEEGLADESALHDDLLRRSQFDPLVDVREAHKGIADGETLYRQSRRRPTWRVMADVMLHFEGQQFASADERASERKHTGSWLYGKRF